ncbi:uncharacterized protein LOC129016036 [Pongo pygmaeus]|uniref:uncharacterized protein LOC129016036 n=1 Tax=Pongo pygmaeus TaxID=9600 RepID=UPI0023E21FE2|nr:uncharacterized protein LOC129016036 [Pongo pygmaeus]
MAWPDAGAPGLPGVTQGSGAGRPLRRGGPGWSGRGGGRSEPVSPGRLRRRGEGGVCCPATRSPRPGRQKELVRYQKNPDAKLGVVLPLPASAPHPPGAAADRAGRASYPLFWPGGELVPPAAARPRPQTPGPLLICICPELRGPGPLEEALASGLKSKGRATCREGGCHLCKGADPSARSEEAAVGRRTARWEAPRIVGCSDHQERCRALSHTGQSRTILTAPAQQTLALWREAGSRSSAFWASVARAGPATAHFCLQPRHPPGPPDAPDLHGG